MIVSYPDRAKVDFVQFTKRRSVSDNKFEKMSSCDPKVMYPVYENLFHLGHI